MKILTGIDIPLNPFGGSPIICNDWYSNLPDGDEALFLAMPSTTEQWWTMANVHFLRTAKVQDPTLYPRYLEQLRHEVRDILLQYKPDIVHLQHLNYGLSRAFVEEASSLPKLGICHGTDAQAALQSAYFQDNLVQITDRADHIVFPTENMARDFLSVYGKAVPYSIIPHGLPVEAFAMHNPHKPERILRLLYAGRLNHYKGADIAVEAIAHLHCPATLDIFGRADEQDYMSKLKHILAEHHLEDRVQFYDQIARHELLDTFSQYDCILIPSRYLEAFSLTAIEAQASGLVVIYGKGGGIQNVLGDSAICINDNLPDTLARIIENIDRERAILLQYREKGYENAKKYQLAQQVSALLTLSHELTRRSIKTL